MKRLIIKKSSNEEINIGDKVKFKKNIDSEIYTVTDMTPSGGLFLENENGSYINIKPNKVIKVKNEIE